MISKNKNIINKKIKKDSVSYLITAFNKKKYAKNVISALIKEGGNLNKEYVLVDDGSNDGTTEVFKSMKNRLPGPLKIIKQKNMGASFATNVGVLKTKYSWIRLVDADDMITKNSTYEMVELAKLNKIDFVFGNLIVIDLSRSKTYKKEVSFKIYNKDKGLKKFIKNCPSNSSGILLSKKRYINSGGCSEDLISPDQLLFLRLFNTGSGIHIEKNVAITPSFSSSRLSSQVRRSRYESVLAINKFITENPNLDHKIKYYAFKRVLSRAYNYHKFFGNSFFSKHGMRYLSSKLFFSQNYLNIMDNALGAFTISGSSVKPILWRTEADRKGVAKTRIKV